MLTNLFLINFVVEARAKGIHVEIGVAEGTLEILDSDEVLGDKFKLYEVLRNLLSNGLKYSSRNSTVSVQIGFCPSTPTPMTAAVPNQQRSRKKSKQGGGKSIHERFVDMITRSFRFKKSSSSSSRGKTSGPRGNSGPRGQNRGSIRDRIVDGFFRSNRVQNNGNEDMLMSSVVDDNEMDMVGELLVVVTDHGVGISIENQKLLFQEGRQFDAENLQTGGGSGFGEYILSTADN